MGDPGGGHQHQLLEPVRLGGRGLGRDEAAHRVADHGAVAHPQRLAEVVQQAPVALDRDLPFGHRRVAEPGQVERQNPMLAGEVGDVLEPVLPRAREAVDEDDRHPGARAQLDVVDPGCLRSRPGAGARASRSRATPGPGCRRDPGPRPASGRGAGRRAARRGRTPPEAARPGWCPARPGVRVLTSSLRPDRARGVGSPCLHPASGLSRMFVGRAEVDRAALVQQASRDERPICGRTAPASSMRPSDAETLGQRGGSCAVSVADRTTRPDALSTFPHRGSAVAVSASNTVQSDDLGPGAQVKAPDVAANAINGSDVVDDSLGGADTARRRLSGRTRKLI